MLIAPDLGTLTLGRLRAHARADRPRPARRRAAGRPAGRPGTRRGGVRRLAAVAAAARRHGGAGLLHPLRGHRAHQPAALRRRSSSPGRASPSTPRRPSATRAGWRPAATTRAPTTCCVSTPDGDGLVFDLEDKPWGPHYFRIGLDLETDFRGGSGFNIKISHNRHWLDANGSEWRNQVQIGKVPRWYTELYHPLNWTLGISNDWFVAGLCRGAAARHHALRQRQRRRDQPVQPQARRASASTSGQPWGEFGELRLGLLALIERTTPDVDASTLSSVDGPVTLRETRRAPGRRGRPARLRQLPDARLPARVGARRRPAQPQRSGLRTDFTRVEAYGDGACAAGASTR